MVQSEWVAAELVKAWPGLEVEIKRIRTQGDKITDVPLARFGGKGLFTQEIDIALLESEIDLAVHSMKDMPSDLVEGISIAAVPRRESPYDVAITREGGAINDLPAGAVFGTSSLRRRAQLLAWRMDIKVTELRGNVDTRLHKLDEGAADAIILAAAGLARLGIGRQHEVLPTSMMLPASSQGALGITARSDNLKVVELLRPLDDPASNEITMIERGLLAKMEGGCQTPIGIHADRAGDQYRLQAAIFLPNGSERIYAEGVGRDREAVCDQVFRDLEGQGLKSFLAKIEDFLQL